MSGVGIGTIPRRVPVSILAPSQTAPANVAPSAAPTSGASTPVDYSTLTSQQMEQLQAAVDAGVKGAGASFTNPQLESSILAKLAATGDWTSQELQALQETWSGAQGANTSTESNKGGGNTAAFEASWFQSGLEGIQNFLGQNATPPSTSNDTSSTDDTSNEIGELLADLPALTSGSSNGTGDTTTGDGPTEPVYYGSSGGATSAGGGSSILGVLMVGAGAALGIWWYEKHHHKGA